MNALSSDTDNCFVFFFSEMESAIRHFDGFDEAMQAGSQLIAEFDTLAVSGYCFGSMTSKFSVISDSSAGFEIINSNYI